MSKYKKGDHIINHYNDIYTIKDVLDESYLMICPSGNEEINSIKIVDKTSSLYSTIWHNSKEELPDEQHIVISYSEDKKKAHIGLRSNIQGYYRWAYLEDIDPQF